MTYLYNGVELPVIPVRFLKQAKYFIISYGALSKTKAMLLIFDHKPFITSEPVIHINVLAGKKYDHKGYASISEPVAWEGDEYDYLTTADENVEYPTKGLIWANFDVPDENGNTCLPASYPIDPETGEEIHDYEPIPEGGEPIDHASFLQGWLVGRRLAGMRK